MDEGVLLQPSVHAGFGAAAATQLRVICALLLREMRGRSRLGYAWTVLAPICQLTFMTFMLTAVKGRNVPIGGSTLALFLSTGLLPYRLFGHLAGRTFNAITNNVTLFMIPIVKPIDAVYAKLLLEIATSFATCLIVFTGLSVLDLGYLPKYPLQAAGAFFSMTILGMGIGTFNAAITRIAPSWDRAYGVITLPMFFISGIWYVPDLLPQQMRDIVVWNPVLHGIEWFRTAFYNDYGHLTLDRGYLLKWALGALLVGLAAERALRGRGLKQ